MRCATNNSGRLRRCHRVWLAREHCRSTILLNHCLLILYLFFNSAVIRAHAVEGKLSEAALQAAAHAEERFKKTPDDPQAAWQFGRTCFDLADFSTNNAERQAIAEEGLAACRQALTRESNSAPARYYLALNMGQLARTKSLGALKLVSEMERELLRAIELDPRFDYAGPERTLGLLYRDAPALLSIGNRAKSRQYLQRAVELVPNYPDNRLSLIESELKWNDRVGAAKDIKLLDELWPNAKREFSGTEWNHNWEDWNIRLQEAKRKLESPARLDTPRH